LQTVNRRNQASPESEPIDGWGSLLHRWVMLDAVDLRIA
jgi:hypothetical protein